MEGFPKDIKDLIAKYYVQSFDGFGLSWMCIQEDRQPWLITKYFKGSSKEEIAKLIVKKQTTFLWYDEMIVSLKAGYYYKNTIEQVSDEKIIAHYLKKINFVNLL